MDLSLDKNGYPTGEDGTVWATYDLRQAETIRNAFVAQHIGCTLYEKKFLHKVMYLLRIVDTRDLDEAIDFVWRKSSGLRLKPDWNYPDGEINKSFEQWLWFVGDMSPTLHSTDEKNLMLVKKLMVLK